MRALAVGVLLATIILGAQVPPLKNFPAEGIVPDRETALALSEVIASRAYTKKLIEKEKPFQVDYDRGVWTVYGSVKSGGAGGVFEIKIRKKDGAVLFLQHTM